MALNHEEKSYEEIEEKKEKLRKFLKTKLRN